MQCDSLVAEVEQKRSLFLADLEQEQQAQQGEVDDVIETFEGVLGASQSLAHSAKDMLNEDTATVLQVSVTNFKSSLKSFRVQDFEFFL